MALKKGSLSFTIAIVGTIVSIGIILGLIIPWFTLKYHLAITLKTVYEYNSADLALLTLVSLKNENGYSAYRILSERTINGFDENTQDFLKEKLRLVTGSDCFKLVTKIATILKPEECQPVENTGSIFIFKPYGEELIEEIILVYNS